MKKYLLNILIIMLGTTFTYAQHFKPNSFIKANKATFKINETEYGSLNVVNVTNAYHGKKSKAPLNLSTLYARKEKGSLLKAFMQVFNDERLKQLVNTDHVVNLTFYIAPTGKIIEVEFLLRKDSSLTPTELEALENAIKNDVFFKLRPDESKGVDFFDISLAVNFQTVLDRIER